MKVLVADREAVAELLPMGECIELMAATLRSLAEGRAILPLRSSLTLGDGRSRMLLMPAALQALGVLGAKVLTIFPGNHGGPYDAHQGAVLLFDTEHGSLRAVVDATSVTALRTAAVSAVATRVLALPEAAELAIVGAGTQGRSHLEAMLAVRPIRRVRVYDREPERAAAFARREGKRHGLPVEAAGSARQAVEGAEIICTVTTASDPVVAGSWVSPGAHINAVGAYTPTTRELDTEAVRRSVLFVDRREAALGEAGEILIPLREGAIEQSHIRGELGELLAGRVAGRGSPEEVTLFKALGIAVEDLAAAGRVLEQARSRKRGAFLEFGGEHAGDG